VAVGDQPVTQMTPEESAGAGHHDATHQSELPDRPPMTIR
jgi:hypothetical protein